MGQLIKLKLNLITTGSNEMLKQNFGLIKGACAQRWNETRSVKRLKCKNGAGQHLMIVRAPSLCNLKNIFNGKQ